MDIQRSSVKPILPYIGVMLKNPREAAGMGKSVSEPRKDSPLTVGNFHPIECGKERQGWIGAVRYGAGGFLKEQTGNMYCFPNVYHQFYILKRPNFEKHQK